MSVLLLRVYTPAGITSLVTRKVGAIDFTIYRSGVNCWDASNDRAEFNYDALSGSNDYGSFYVTLVAKDGYVDKISCSINDVSGFITVQEQSPTESFMLEDFTDWGPLAESESVSFQGVVSVIGDNSWTNATTKTVSVSCDVEVCDSGASDEGVCDFYRTVEFRHSDVYPCS